MCVYAIMYVCIHALYSSMGKIVDMLISGMYSNQLMTSHAQFAFKKCHSTTTIQYNIPLFRPSIYAVYM